MDTRAFTKTGEVVVVEDSPTPPPLVGWFVLAALCTLPIHALIALIYWSLS